MSYLFPQFEMDGIRASLKATARAATTGNVDLALAVATVDTDVTLADNDRVLVRAQTDLSENGIYTWSLGTGLFTRARDALALSSGLLVTVTEGLLFKDTLWKLATDNPITVGTDNLTFTEIFSSVNYLLLQNQSSAPTTAAAEAGFFVDGSNRLSYRAESNGVTLPLTGVVKTYTVATLVQVDGVSLQVSGGQFSFYPTEWGGESSFYFEVVLSVTDVLRTAQVWLYNLTDMEIVTSSVQSTSNLGPTKLRAALSVGGAAGDFQSTEKVYEVRLSIDGTLVTEQATLGTATLIVI